MLFDQIAYLHVCETAQNLAGNKETANARQTQWM